MDYQGQQAAPELTVNFNYNFVNDGQHVALNTIRNLYMSFKLPYFEFERLRVETQRLLTKSPELIKLLKQPSSSQVEQPAQVRHPVYGSLSAATPKLGSSMRPQNHTFRTA